MRNYVTTFNPFFDQLLFGSKSTDSKLMRTNIIENNESYVLSIELPDIEKDNIKISLKEGNLNVTATREENVDEETVYLLKERHVGTYSRSYYVGEEVKLEHISAKLNNGVLTLTIKKIKEEKPTEQFINIE